MTDPLIHDCDNYLIMEPGEKEKFLNAQETLEWLEKWLIKLEELPIDLKDLGSHKDVARHLLDTACDLEIKPGFTIQWFAIRLDRSASD